MSEIDWSLADEAAASLLANGALTQALLTTLQERGLLSKADIDVVFHDAATALETAEAGRSALIGRARQILERKSRNLASKPK